MTVRVARFAFRSRAKYCGHVVVTLDIGLRREVQITTIRLRFARERVAQILFGFRAFELLHMSLLDSLTTLTRGVRAPPQLQSNLRA